MEDSRQRVSGYTESYRDTAGSGQIPRVRGAKCIDGCTHQDAGQRRQPDDDGSVSTYRARAGMITSQMQMEGALTMTVVSVCGLLPTEHQLWAAWSACEGA